MKSLILSNSDINFGASRAAYRLHRGLLSIGVDSQMMVQTKLSDDASVLASAGNAGKVMGRLRERWEELPLKLYPKRDSTKFSVQWLPEKVADKVAKLNPDLINIHWICGGYLQIETIGKLHQPLVWTFHDMWAFTGGCQYAQECDRFTHSCGSCPQLGSHKDADLSRWVWQRKAKAFKKLNLTVVTPSVWLAKCAQASSLFQNRRIEVIPNGIDTQVYKPIERSIARKILNLPQDKRLILFGAINATSDRRKGFHLLEPALQNLSKAGWQDQVELVVLGASPPRNPIDLGFKAHYLGRLNDDYSLALVYAAADVFAAPSVQDNLPNTVMEAIACGTPCVAFEIGGMPDMIEHYGNGYLARAFDIDDFAQGIAWVLENPERHQKLCDRARQKTEQEFTQEIQAHRYTSLYGEILK